MHSTRRLRLRDRRWLCGTRLGSVRGLRSIRPRTRASVAALAATAFCLSLVLGVAIADAVSPIVTIEAASNAEYTTAEVKGTVNPEGEATSYGFQVITGQAFSEHRDAVQQLTVAATAGTYALGFEGSETAPIAFDADAAGVQAALITLPGIGAGAVSVTGGPGDETGLLRT